MTPSEGLHRIFGSDLSPYSVKVRSYFRYKGIPHEWVVRSSDNMDEFRRHAKLPLIPLVLTPAGEALQDSTPVLELLEECFPEPALQPADPALAFLSALIEEYADEWGNKPMFHYRWTYAADRDSAAERIARDNLPRADEAAIRAAMQAITARMVPRLALVGSTPATARCIEASFERQLAILERHLEGRPFLLGGRPALADFGLFAQLYECSTDPTPGARMRESAPRTLAWIQRMLAPRSAGAFEPSSAGAFQGWSDLEPTLTPLLRDEVAGLFLPWSVANERALAAGEKELRVLLGGESFVQEPQKYHAKSLRALRERLAAVPDRSRLDPILDATGCTPWLKG
jgi:glutathione S-transferase